MNRNINNLLVLGLIIASTCLSGCKNCEYNVEKNGIHFKKINQSENGTIIGYMTENHEIWGFPCEKGWIHFKENWKLKSFQLSKEFTYNHTLLPAHTWIHLPHHEEQTGHVCSLPFDYEIQGYLCGGSGGYKGTHTGFYKSGRLKSFYPPDDLTVDRVPCKATPFVYVDLYENGHIRSCKLAEDHQVDGVTIKKGELINFHENGKIK
jgi:hypothetical protein